MSEKKHVSGLWVGLIHCGLILVASIVIQYAVLMNFEAINVDIMTVISTTVATVISSLYMNLTYDISNKKGVAVITVIIFVVLFSWISFDDSVRESSSVEIASAYISIIAIYLMSVFFLKEDN